MIEFYGPQYDNPDIRQPFVLVGGEGANRLKFVPIILLCGR